MTSIRSYFYLDWYKIPFAFEADIVPYLLVHHFPKPFYRIEVWSVGRQIVKLDVQHIGGVFYSVVSVIPSTIQKEGGDYASLRCLLSAYTKT